MRDVMEKQTPQGVPIWKSNRGILALMGSVAFFFMYLLRANLSVAMVCMVKGNIPDYGKDLNTSFLNESRNATEVNEHKDGCGYLQKTQGVTGLGEFEWSKTTQGYILSSFYYGYIMTQIAGGWLACRVGGKHVLGTGLLVSILATLLIPVAARTHVAMVIAMRVITGMGMGVVFPAMHALIGRWAPPFERTKLSAFIYAGTMIGTVAAMALSGVLCSVSLDKGWPLIFYIFGGAGCLWWVGWNFSVYSSPYTHPRISKAETLYIEETIGVPTASSQWGGPVPWRSIWTSLPVWAIIVAHMCINWGSYTILSCIPMYMRDVLMFDIKQNGLLSALPYLSKYIACILLAEFVDTIRAKKIVSTKTIRKVFQGISCFGPAVVMAIIGYMDCSNRMVAVALLTIVVTLIAFGRCAYLVNHVDIAPRFSGILLGLSNTAATIPGMVAPTVAGALTPNGTREEWQRVFFICCGTYTFGGIFYILFSDGEEQEWAKQHDQPKATVCQEDVLNEEAVKLKPDSNQYPVTDFTEDQDDDEITKI